MRKTCVYVADGLCMLVGTTMELSHKHALNAHVLRINRSVIPGLYKFCTRVVHRLFIGLTSYISGFTHLPHSLYKQKLIYKLT